MFCCLIAGRLLICALWMVFDLLLLVACWQWVLICLLFCLAWLLFDLCTGS